MSEEGQESGVKRSSRLKYVPFYILIVILVIWGGLAEYANLFGTGQDSGLTNYVPWGLWVASYVYLIGLSAGAFLLSSLVYGFGVKQLKPVGRFALFTAIVTLFMALLMIFSDIGQPSRATEIYLDPNFGSMMAWLVWLYTAYFLLLLGELFFAFRVEYADWRGSARSGFRHLVAKVVLLGKDELSAATVKRDSSILKVLALVGIPLAVAFHGGVGSLFATVATQALWHTPLTPILFVLGALFSGGALLTGLIVFFWPRKDSAWRDAIGYLAKVLLVMGLIYALFQWAEYSIPLWYGYGDVREAQSLNSLLFGPYWYVLWVFQVLLGTVIPLALLYFGRKNVRAIGIGGLMVALCFLAVRLDIVIPAYVAPQLQDFFVPNLGANYSYSYFPTLFEWQLLVFIVSLGMGLLILGYRLLPLVEKVLPEYAQGTGGDGIQVSGVRAAGSTQHRHDESRA